MSPTLPDRTAEQLASILNQLRQLAERGGRADLRERFTRVERALANKTVDVIVVGQIKQGKSALVNALVSAPVCPVDDVLGTSIPTIVRWGEERTAQIITDMQDDDGDVSVTRTRVHPDRLRQHVTELAGDSGFIGNPRAEITVPRRILATGLAFIDTPGVNGAQTRASGNLTLLPEADAAIMVTDATQELTAPELAFLKRARSLCPRLVCVVSKTDLQHQWREIVAANTEHLTRADMDVQIIPTSALLHDIAVRESDAELREEANIDTLAKHLIGEVRKDVLTSRQESIADDIESIGEHLAMVIEAELAALDDAGSGADVVANLQRAEERAELLAQRSARWQQTLADGAGDLISDIEFDLRDRLRGVQREAEELISGSDPGKSWDEIGVWLAESISQAVSDNFIWAHQRCTHLAGVVAEHFSIDGRAAIPEIVPAGAEEALVAIGDLDAVDPGKLSVGQRLMIGMKGSYGGVLMFGLLTTLAGMALVNPISIAAGLIMGGFAYRQDAQQRLEQRRNEAKTAVRKLIDESMFQVGKESRDRMNRIRRTLRDHFSMLAEELKQSLNESVRVAKQQASLPKSERGDRAARARAELQEIRRLCEAARQVTKTQSARHVAAQ